MSDFNTHVLLLIDVFLLTFCSLIYVFLLIDVFLLTDAFLLIDVFLLKKYSCKTIKTSDVGHVTTWVLKRKKKDKKKIRVRK